jgi:hypothetical protein
MNLGVLNTIIAVVIVLLILSLIVQAVQGFVKKMLKLKSSEIVKSLEDLYEQALAAPAVNPPVAGGGAAAGGGQAAVTTSAAKLFTERVLGEFREIGRVTRRGTPILDSLSKGDLLKIMAKLESEGFVPDYVAKFQAMVDELNQLQKAIGDLSKSKTLTGAASAKLAEIRMVLAPLFYDVQAILDGDKVKPKVVFGDLLRLGNIKLNAVPELLNDAQVAITQEIEVAGKNNLPDRVTALQTLSGELANIAALTGDLSQKFDNALAPLRIKIAQVETWYDTVMQSFDERYARSMKSVAIYISIVVVILLNANFFNVYRSLSKNAVQTNLIVANGERLLEAEQKSNATPTPTPAPTPVDEKKAAAPPAQPLPTLAASSAASPTETASPSPEASPAKAAASPSPSPVDIKKQAEETKRTIDQYVNMYQDFGFVPLSAEQFNSWLWSLGGWTWFWAHGDRGGFWGFTITRDGKGVPLTVPINGVRRTIPMDCHEVDNDGKAITYDGKKKVSCTPDWRPVTRGEWWESRKHDTAVAFGWAIMVLLLSVGAPFWQDALESLFGVKNLLRQKSGTQNIEKASGAGQPKT